MRPRPGEVLHFSEDPTITVFTPHVAPTSPDRVPYVWAVDGRRAPDYWFPRQCPRILAWAEPTTTLADRRQLLGPGAPRVHLIEYGWLPALQTVELYAYRLAAEDFRPYGDGPTSHAHVATVPVRPLGSPEPVGDLLALHAAAGIELRLTASLWPWWRVIAASTLGFSGIRLRNAAPDTPDHGGSAALPEADRENAAESAEQDIHDTHAEDPEQSARMPAAAPTDRR